MRQIGIVGSAYSGSTIIGCILDGCEGVEFLGETHALLDGAKCRCGRENCWLRLEPGETLSEMYDAAPNGNVAVVTSNKWPPIYEKTGTRPDHVLHVFRHPYEWCASWILHCEHLVYGRDSTSETVQVCDADVSDAASKWENSNRACLEYGELIGAYSSLSVNNFSLFWDKGSLNSLCTELGLTATDKCNPANAHLVHHVNGNAGVGGSWGDRPLYQAEHDRYYKKGEMSPHDGRCRNMFNNHHLREIERVCFPLYGRLIRESIV